MAAALNDEPHLKLIRDLESQPPSETREELLRQARAGEFHCEVSDRKTPKHDLVAALEAAGYANMLGNKLDEYDNEIALSEDEQKMIAVLMTRLNPIQRDLNAELTEDERDSARGYMERLNGRRDAKRGARALLRELLEQERAGGDANVDEGNDEDVGDADAGNAHP